MNEAYMNLAREFLAAGVFAHVDVHTVALVAPRWNVTDPLAMLGLAFAVRAPRLGHAGVDLTKVRAQFDDDRTRHAPDGDRDDEATELRWPDDVADWVRRTHACAMVGTHDDTHTPFVCQRLNDASTLLLTRRMYTEQCHVAAALRERAARPVGDMHRVHDLDDVMARLFAGDPTSEAASAVRLADAQRLAIVTGGPGTGKTYSITRLLAALIEGEDPARPLSIALAAPTGKAAVRMREAIREAAPGLDVSDTVKKRLVELEAKTLHKLVHLRPDGGTRHGLASPLAHDVVVVDEVSMVDLALMRRLVEAVHPDARLVLLGDRDQLASVEAGCVLADMVATGAGALASHVQRFTRSRRFEAAPDVAMIAACLRSDHVEADGVPEGADERVAYAVAVMCDLARDPSVAANVKVKEPHPGKRVRWLHAGEPARDGAFARPTAAQLEALAAPYVDGFDELRADGTRVRLEGYVARLKTHVRGPRAWSDALREPGEQRALLDALDRYRVLAVHRRGALGVEGLATAIEARVRAAVTREREGDAPRYWVGRPLIVTENAYEVGLMNGDVGLVLPHGDAKGLAAVFPAADGAGVHAVALARLPRHEGALVMTVHKAQGSQFDHVALVLAGRASPIQTREIVYTGVTRAKNRLTWLGGEHELREALARRVTRASGLTEMLGANTI